MMHASLDPAEYHYADLFCPFDRRDLSCLFQPPEFLCVVLSAQTKRHHAITGMWYEMAGSC